MTTRQQIATRMRRKVEVMLLDAKAKQDPARHDINELLTLLDMLERAHGKGVTNGDA
jgi:hypothetical protein